ncbi:MAG: hypothetical protein IPN29_05570 [Saprospiraceae bacterium]|nr:hypothetical protein [Saprospiraceae bacterium]
MNIDYQYIMFSDPTQDIKSKYGLEQIVWRLMFFLFPCLFLIPGIPMAQNGSHNLGTAPILHFPKSIYTGGTQTWDICQDERGVMYFANNDGLLEYDGSRWQLYKVSNQTIVRSLAIDTRGRIFVGAQSELGFFYPDEPGVLKYQSLVSLIPGTLRNFEDVWDIVISGDRVYFRTNKLILVYQEGKVEILLNSNGWLGMYAVDKEVFVQDETFALFQLKGLKTFGIPSIAALTSPATGMMAWKGDTTLVTTLKSGIFYLKGDKSGPWKTDLGNLLYRKRIYSAGLLQDHQLALGTSLDGLLVIDSNKKLLHHFNKKKGLQNNNVLSTYVDRHNNVWLGLDNGIACILLESPFTSIIPDRELSSTGYTAAVFKDRLYLGLSDGLYTVPWKKYYRPGDVSLFRKIDNTDGQVWNLSALGDHLLLGHHEGSFEVERENATRISNTQGGWTFIEVDKTSMLGGNYRGIQWFRRQANGHWQPGEKLPGLDESCRIMVKDNDGTVWVSHPYRGVYRITSLKPETGAGRVEFYHAKNGLPSDLNNYVFSIAGKAVFGTEKGVWRFDKDKKRFIPAADFNEAIGNNLRVKCLKEDGQGNIWYVADNEVGMLKVDDLGLKKETQKMVFPELERKLVGGFEFIYPVDEHNVFFGAEEGFIHYDPFRDKSGSDKLYVLLTRIEANGKDIVFGGWFNEDTGLTTAQGNAKKPALSYHQNNLTFYFTAPRFRYNGLLEYRTRLDNFEDSWSSWSVEPRKQYNNLHSGRYTFVVQARIKGGQQSAEVKYKFSILPPWYASPIALGFYFLLFAALIVFLLKRQYARFEAEKQKLEAQHKEAQEQQMIQVEQTKAALVQMQNEKLAADIAFKNQELASATMHLVQKGEVLLTIQNALNQILEKSANAEVKKEVQGLINLMSFDTKIDEDWEQFSHHFDQVHVNFLERLRKQYPQITANDEKLCAYLRLNLSTKETAQMMNISVRGVEASRYRLRKKLGLSNEVNLTEFMIKI